MGTVSNLVEDIKRFRLKDLRVESGVPGATLIDIRDGKTTQPRIDTVEKIQAACKRLDQKAAKKASRQKADEKQKKSRKSAKPEAAA